MLPRRFIVHVGYPKTGSTALQEACVTYRQQLEPAGVLYPESLVTVGTSKHEELCRLIRVNKVQQALSHLAGEVALSAAHTVLLSTESIVNQLDRIDDSRWVAFFQGLGQFGNLELLLVVRHPADLLLSYYKQAVVNQPSRLMSFYATPLPLSEFAQLPEIRSFLHLPSVIAKLERFSSAKVVKFDYSLTVVTDVLNWVVGSRFEIQEPARANEGLQPEEVELIRQINARQLPDDQRNAWFKALNHCCKLSNTTATTLANRASDQALLTIDANWLLKCQHGSNPRLGVSAEKLSVLTNKVCSWLVEHQRTNGRHHA
jgi:hypothetical protein